MINGPLINNLADRIVFYEFLLSLIVSVIFVAVYAFRHWWSSPQGRALMIKSLGNSFLLSLGLATLMFGQHWTGRGTVRLIGMTLFCAGLCYLLHGMLFAPGAENYPPRSWVRRWVRRRR